MGYPLKAIHMGFGVEGIVTIDAKRLQHASLVFSKIPASIFFFVSSMPAINTNYKQTDMQMNVLHQMVVTYFITI
jgi:hypothetical protein